MLSRLPAFDAAQIRATAILNPGSGAQKQQEFAEELSRVFEEHGGDLRIGLARDSKHIYQFAREAVAEHCPLVLAGGGDGTISAVASVLAGTDTALGVLPMGTFNYFARRLGIPLDIGAAARLCFEGEIRPVSLGEVNERIFLNNASIGLYPSMLREREKTYRRFGRSQFLAYYAALLTLIETRRHMKVFVTTRHEQHEMRTPLVFAVNNSYQLEQYELEGSECVKEGGMATYILPPVGRMGLLRLGWRMLRRNLEPHTDFKLVCSEGMRVETSRSTIDVAYDGEMERMQTPLTFRVRKDALRVLVPRDEGELR